MESDFIDTYSRQKLQTEQIVYDAAIISLMTFGIHKADM